MKTISSFAYAPYLHCGSSIHWPPPHRAKRKQKTNNEMQINPNIPGELSSSIFRSTNIVVSKNSSSSSKPPQNTSRNQLPYHHLQHRNQHRLSIINIFFIVALLNFIEAYQCQYHINSINENLWQVDPFRSFQIHEIIPKQSSSRAPPPSHIATNINSNQVHHDLQSFDELLQPILHQDESAIVPNVMINLTTMTTAETDKDKNRKNDTITSIATYRDSVTLPSMGPVESTLSDSSSLARKPDHEDFNEIKPHQLIANHENLLPQTSGQTFTNIQENPKTLSTRYQARNNRHMQMSQSSLRPKNKYPPPSQHQAVRGGGAFGGARWPSRNNMYKRVLVCDKTLISLDYIKKQHRPPPGPPLNNYHKPWAEAHHEPGHDSWNNNNNNYNNIDIGDMGFDEFLENGSTSSSSSSQSELIRPVVAESNNNKTGRQDQEPISARSMMNSESGDYRSYRQADFEWLLPDDDPLVLCDMWDLEKGLLNRKPPESLLAMAIKTDFNTVREAIKRCRHLSERTIPYVDTEFRDGIEISTEDMISMYSIKRGLIPGTKWCGLGDIASDYNDLGQKRRIDICCRAHDHCPIRLKPFRNDYGLLNIAFYTKSHCECDADFYRCLRDVRSKTADMLGNLYFNVMKLQCLREEPMKMCREIRPTALGFGERCIKYEHSLNKTVYRFSTPPVQY